METNTLFVTDMKGLLFHNINVDKNPDFASEVFDIPSRTRELAEQITRVSSVILICYSASLWVILAKNQWCIALY